MATGGVVGQRRDRVAAKKAPVARRAYPPPTTPATPVAVAAFPATVRAGESAAVASGAMPVHRPGKSRLTLERVLGVTALSNAMMSVNPVSGEIAYAAGCIVVIYNLRRNKQVRYYRVDKSVSCLCFSPNGQYLAIGEKGYMPAITIWDGSNGALCAELQLHKFGVACMAFSQDGAWLLSAGLIHDQHIYTWKLTRDNATGRMTSKAVGVAHVEDKVLSVDFCQEGSFFVTVGEKHFKFWSFDGATDFNTTGMQINGIDELAPLDAELATKTEATFTSVACGYGLCKLKTFAVTLDGTLCCFGATGAMERLVSLETPTGYAVSVTEAYVAVGGASSIVRLFDPTTLEYRATLPFPPAFGTAGQQGIVDESIETPLYPDQPHRFPTAVAVRVSGSHVIAMYSDRSIFIYDVSDIQTIRVERSFLFHCGGIRDMKVVGRPRGISARGKLVYEVNADARRIERDEAGSVLPNGSFVTCSDDNTLRIWHLDLHKKPVATISRFDPSAGNAKTFSEAWKNPHSQDMLAVIYHDSEQAFEDEDSVVLGSCCSHQDAFDIHSPPKDRGQSIGLRTVAIRPDQQSIAAGDSEGNVIVASLPVGSAVTTIGAHNSEVHSVAYTALPTTSGSSDHDFIMVSGGRDRLIQVYDCNKDYTVTNTLENHSGAVTTLKFASDGSKLLSGGADKTVVFSDVSTSGNIARVCSIPFNNGKVFDFDITSDGKTVVVASNNRLDMMTLSSGKQIKFHHVGEHHHIDVSPGNVCVAVSGSLSDKTIQIIDFESGETLASATGHGETITSVRFTPDCRRLLSSSSDGCIFVWRLSEDIQSAIKSRLPRITDSSAALPSPPKRSPQHLPVAPVLMPPPPPPLHPISKTVLADIAAQRVAEAKNGSRGTPAPSVKESKKKKQVEEVSCRVPRDASTNILSEPKHTSGDWRGKIAAVPGPMSDIPIEDWMKTRDSARKAVDVADNSSCPRRDDSVQAGVTEAVLSIDRSETPDWARTALSAHHMVSMSDVIAPPKPPTPPVARGKWSGHNQAFIFQNTEDSKETGFTDSSLSQSPLRDDRGNASPTATAIEADIRDVSTDGDSDTRDIKQKNQLLKLSVGDLALSPRSSLQTSTSLALEREQLGKRQKQIDTANAVAAMNMKLSQLGLLKAGSRPEERRRSVTSPQFNELGHRSPTPRSIDAETPTPQSTFAPTESHDVEAETDSNDERADNDGDDDVSIGYSRSSSTSSTRSSILGSDQTSLLGNDSRDMPSAHVERVERQTQETVNVRPDIPPEMLESIDLPLYSRDSLHAESSTEASAILDAVSPIHQPLVNQSLSLFTQGFAVNSSNETSTTVDADRRGLQQCIPVDRSLSAFSSGYTKDPTATKLTHSLEAPRVTVSLSSFTTGYEACHAELDGVTGESEEEVSRRPQNNASLNCTSSKNVNLAVPVDCSVSAFTTGYTVETAANGIVAPIRAESIPPSELAQSISAFTSGYLAGNDENVSGDSHRSVDAKTVAASLSSFTAGYESVVARDGCQEMSTDAVSAGSPTVPRVTTNRQILNNITETRQSGLEGGGVCSEGLTAKTAQTDVMQSLSAFTAGYEIFDDPPTSTPSSTDIVSGKASENSLPRVPVQAQKVVSAISTLDEQLRTASVVFEEYPLTDSPGKGSELECIQQLVGELRAAIKRLDDAS